jgi:hypothetical protein
MTELLLFQIRLSEYDVADINYSAALCYGDYI